VSLSTRQAYAEIDNFLELLDEIEKNKIPINLRKIFKQEKDKNYIKNIDINIPISKQNLKEETFAIIALLNLKYWCDDEVEKERLRKIYEKNEEIYKEELDKIQTLDYTFEISEGKKDPGENFVGNQIIEYKEEKIYKRIFNNIKKLFRGCK